MFDRLFVCLFRMCCLHMLFWEGVAFPNQSALCSLLLATAPKICLGHVNVKQ